MDDEKCFHFGKMITRNVDYFAVPKTIIGGFGFFNYW